MLQRVAHSQKAERLLRREASALCSRFHERRTQSKGRKVIET